jgi:hypothetical protein
VNREVQFFLSRLWQSLVHSVKERKKKKLLSKDKAVLAPNITLFYLYPHEQSFILATLYSVALKRVTLVP